MPIQAIEPRRLYRQIADQLRTLIDGGEFPPGSRLPTERDLAAQLGVSRPSVREALIALEVEGVIEVRMSSGIYVRQRAARVLVDTRTVDGPLETIRARQVVEGELAAMAARAASPVLVAALTEAVDLMDQDIDGGVMPLRGDRLFHLRVAEAAENGPLLRVVTQLFDERNNPLFERLGRHFENADNWRTAVAEHRRVVQAVKDGDPDAACAAMREHLQRSHDRFTANWPVNQSAPLQVPDRITP
ncbi:FadR/GntR family transcriptional regulator [Azohydromonas lata]|uniref:FadR/GntR family transcriptional regulator n=1 Tax=Azohydromonas lata TaxID=45677 RepID=UPI000833E16A|nr:FadR/GntR family transcriptional regulator [Azohydromonas lata]